MGWLNIEECLQVYLETVDSLRKGDLRSIAIRGGWLHRILEILHVLLDLASFRLLVCPLFCKIILLDKINKFQAVCFSFIIIYIYNCFILLFVTVLSFLLCLTYKLNFIIGRYACMYRKNIVYIGFGTIHGSRHPRGWEVFKYIC